MATLRRITVVWAGVSGLPGVSVFFSDAAGDATASLGAFFTAIKSYFPAPLSWQIPSSGDTVSDTNGHLVGAWSGGTAATINATGAAPHAAGTGAMVRWETGTIVGTRRLRGRTFLAPLNNSQYDNAGTILDVTVGVLQTAANVLAGGGILRTFHRPSGPGASDGSSAPIISGVVPDKVVSIRSRRY